MRAGVVVQPVVLEGQLARLEPLTLGHALALARAASGNRDTFGYTWVPEGEAETRVYIEDALGLQARGEDLPFATIDRASGDVVGCTRFLHIEYWNWPPGNPNDRGPEYPDALEIGWTWLTAEAQRTGINREAKYLMLRHAFEVFRVHRVQLITDSRNSRSRRAIEALGCRLDAVIRASRDGRDGIVRETALFSMLESEWPAARAALAARR